MKLSYENNFKPRTDGRCISHMAAFMEQLRHEKPKLSVPDTLSPDILQRWQGQVRDKIEQLLCLPEVTPQPAPVQLSTAQRDGYRVEKWELYPDDYSAVPVLLLIPDAVSAEHKAPGVLCLPGSCCSKEFLAGEPLINNPACGFQKYPERNKMALHYVKQGMVALALDNPETAECQVGDHMGVSRTQMCYGLLFYGLNYPGLSVFQKLLALDFLEQLPFVDHERIAVSAHSLGTVPALCLGLLRKEVQAVVFNDYVCDEVNFFVSVTEEDEEHMNQNSGNWHIIPGMWKWFNIPDLLAALAPKYLALNEGSAQEFLDTVATVYRAVGAEDHLQITHYPKYADPAARSLNGPVPDHDLSWDTYCQWYNLDAPDHSFRAEPSIRLLKKVFGG